MSETKNIDDLVTLLRSKRAELTALGNEIESSASETVVAFVDLSSSTELKNEVEPQEWLGYVYEFLQSIAQSTKESGGVVVKRIGDELMLTFKTTAMCETFLDMIMQKELLNRYTFKIGVDFGSAFHFKFAEHLESDPYGQVVDRCARIAKLAGAGSIVVSCFYRDALDQPSKYVEVGEFHLKGIPTPVQVFLRPLHGDASNEYIQPLIDALNDKELAIGGYHFTYKKFPTHYFRALPKSEARPFLLRELLNAPQLPMSAGELSTVLNETKDPDKESQYIGYLVEWEGEFESFQRSDEKITVNLNIAGSKGPFFRCTLCLA
jgi:class 3 adenylate cyclase